MNFEMKLKIGETEIVVKEEAANTQEFFEKASFYASLPTKGTKGGTNLVLTYRCVGKNYKYYSIVDKDTNMEYKFGQSLDDKGSLFAGHKTEDGKYSKEWVPVYGSDGNGEEKEYEVEEKVTPVVVPVKEPEKEQVTPSTPITRGPFGGRPPVNPPVNPPVTPVDDEPPVTVDRPSVRATLDRFKIKR